MDIVCTGNTNLVSGRGHLFQIIFEKLKKILFPEIFISLIVSALYARLPAKVISSIFFCIYVVNNKLNQKILFFMKLCLNDMEPRRCHAENNY